MGHYFSFRKATKDSDEWFLISDTHTEKVSEQKMKRHVPYMLFYELDKEVYEKDSMARSMKQIQDLEEKQGKEKQQDPKSGSKRINRLILQNCVSEAGGSDT